MDYSAALFNKKITADMLGKWRAELSALQPGEEQQRYYDAVIRPALDELDIIIEHRHERP